MTPWHIYDLDLSLHLTDLRLLCDSGSSADQITIQHVFLCAEQVDIPCLLLYPSSLCFYGKVFICMLSNFFFTLHKLPLTTFVTFASRSSVAEITPGRRQLRQGVHKDGGGADANRQTLHNESGPERVSRLLLHQPGIHHTSLRREIDGETQPGRDLTPTRAAQSHFINTHLVSPAGLKPPQR